MFIVSGIRSIILFEQWGFPEYLLWILGQTCKYSILQLLHSCIVQLKLVQLDYTAMPVSESPAICCLVACSPSFCFWNFERWWSNPSMEAFSEFRIRSSVVLYSSLSSRSCLLAFFIWFSICNGINACIYLFICLFIYLFAIDQEYLVQITNICMQVIN